ncbi:hypothetical protein ADUPG1_013613 [Aduncisulcus paluster]|uniref:Uncharacterized protein n=1 Tax=Aduncisulcus paluster TaxID=2918883 RepID=A0ABQ5K6T4_9EUKA|nr:hypothetical protein ADUPG1_013613 [Aduncisulcus paluster]
MEQKISYGSMTPRVSYIGFLGPSWWLHWDRTRKPGCVWYAREQASLDDDSTIHESEGESSTRRTSGSLEDRYKWCTYPGKHVQYADPFIAITDDKTRERDQQYLTNVLKVQEKWAGYSRVNVFTAGIRSSQRIEKEHALDKALWQIGTCNKRRRYPLEQRRGREDSSQEEESHHDQVTGTIAEPFPASYYQRFSAAEVAEDTYVDSGEEEETSRSEEETSHEELGANPLHL